MRFPTIQIPSIWESRFDGHDTEGKQIERLTAMKRGRDAAAVEQSLAALKEAAAGETNLMPPIVEASRAYVRLGEMRDALREVWGTWRETPVF